MGGLIINDGGADITARGVCYGTEPYYARAYATNSEGTGYGNEINFKTIPGAPPAPPVRATVITVIPYGGISYYSAKVGGDIITLGDASDVETGICYGTETNPVFEGQHIKTVSTNSEVFTCSLANLMPDVVYHARAYVAWGEEWIDWVVLWPKWVVYGNEITFRTSE